MSPKEYTARVSKISEWASGLKSIYLVFDGEKMDYKAGQYLMMSAEIDGKKESRAYSIASAPQDEAVEIVFRVVGPFTKYLDTLKVNDTIKVIGPFGHLTTETAKEKNLIFIATGTGISPLLSMVRDIHKKGMCGHFDSITLLYGTRYKNMLVHREELELHEKTCPHFRFVPILSREEGWVGRKGHIQQHLPEFVRKDADYFVCGLREMTDEIEKILSEKGVAKENIHLERY
jgi:ferredoxin-NADP reductase